MLKPNLKVFALLFLAPLISYGFILNNDFLGDDLSWILWNSELNSLYTSITGGLGDRPLLMALMWLEKMFFDLNPIGFRVVNIFIHALASFQLYKLMCDFRESVDDDLRLPFIIALIFSVHPLSGQAIYIVIQAGVLLSGLFGLMSLRSFFRWIRSGHTKDMWMSFLWIVVGILFKPNLSFLPFLYVIILAVMKPTDWLAKVKRLWPHFLALGIPFCFYFFMKMNNQENPLNSWNYFLVQCEVLFVYFKLMHFPVGLRYLYDFDPPRGLDYHYLLLLAHILILYLGKRFLKSKLQYVLFLGFYLSFLPESGFFPIKHIAFEHRTYFGLIFLYLLISEVLFDRKVRFEKMAKTISALVLTSFIVLAQARNFQIKPIANWFLHTLENSDSQHDYNVNFSVNLLKMGHPDIIEPMVEKFLKKYPNNMEYKGLELMVKAEKDPANVFDYCKQLGQIAVTAKLYAIHRVDFNNFLVTKLNKDDAPRAHLMVLETTLANQIALMGKHKIYKKLVDFYKSYAINLLRLGERNPAMMTEFWSLRIKAILTRFYGYSFPGLKQQVDAALEKNPQEPFLLESAMLLAR